MRTPPRLARLAFASVVLSALTFTTSCGNRLPGEAFAGPGGSSASPSGSMGVSGPGVGALDAAGPGIVPSGRAGNEKPTDTQAPAAPAPVGGKQQAPGGSAAPGAAAQTAAKGAGAGTSTGVGSATAPCAKTLSPIVVGQTGAFSGVVGAQHGGLRDGLALWVQHVNSLGGVQCHPIRLYSLDDGSDPGRAAANWNDLVRTKHAVAIIGTSEPLTGAAYRSSAERDQVPIVGGDGSTPEFWRSPYMFSQGGEALASYDIGQRYGAKATGAKKIGLVYCVEASICTEQKNNFPVATKRMGYEVGPIQAVSLTQTDYTAECQSMKTAGVQTVWIMVDGSAITRFLRSCASLGYYPTGVTGATAIGNPKAGEDPQMRRNGIYMGAQVAPFIANDTPGLKEFHAASARFAPDLPVGHATLMGWTSGKLFEAALAAVAPQARAGEVTTQTVLNGLWQLKDETLDGLGPGVTFVKGQPAPPTRCAFVLAIGRDGWFAPLGSQRECL